MEFKRGETREVIDFLKAFKERPGIKPTFTLKALIGSVEVSSVESLSVEEIKLRLEAWERGGGAIIFSVEIIERVIKVRIF